MNNDTVEKGKTFAIIAYLHLLGAIIAIVQNNEHKNPFTSFHIRQGLGITLLSLLLGIPVGGFDSWLVSGPFYAFFFILWSFSIIGAIQGKMYLVPFLGPFFQNTFKNL
jgi:uncharacterized membrane protein